MTQSIMQPGSFNVLLSTQGGATGPISYPPFTVQKRSTATMWSGPTALCVPTLSADWTCPVRPLALHPCLERLAITSIIVTDFFKTPEAILLC